MMGTLRGGRSLFGGRTVLSTILRRVTGDGDETAYQTFRRAVEEGDADRAARLAALFWSGRP
ncbi:hypothetical protein EI613_12715 [Azospirillum sp. 412522]|nr:hypothetical protein [Azospirillum sp. 412522]MBY6262764.1 hypothetical protein [Azospirillum sp. 412522]